MLNMDGGALEYKSLLIYQSQNQELRTNLQNFTSDIADTLYAIARVTLSPDPVGAIAANSPGE